MRKAFAIFAVLGIVASSAVADGTNDLFARTLNYREILRCGPNSLYLFLVLSGHSEVTLEQLENVPVSPEGTSLASLREVARQFNVETEIRRYDFEEIDRIPLPAIGQFRTTSASLTALHFDVIYRVDSENVYLLNGTTGEPFFIRRRPNLRRWWTGVAMFENRSLASRIMDQWRVLSGAGLVAINLVASRYWFRRRKIRKDRGVTIGSGVAA
jgi:hypothetical protein